MNRPWIQRSFALLLAGALTTPLAQPTTALADHKIDQFPASLCQSDSYMATSTAGTVQYVPLPAGGARHFTCPVMSDGYPYRVAVRVRDVYSNRAIEARAVTCTADSTSACIWGSWSDSGIEFVGHTWLTVAPHRYYHGAVSVRLRLNPSDQVMFLRRYRDPNAA